jgi:hypothetical protein
LRCPSGGIKFPLGMDDTGKKPLMRVTIGGKELKEGEIFHLPGFEKPAAVPPAPLAPLVTIKGVRTRARIKFEFDTSDDWDPRDGPFPLREFSAADLRDVLRLFPELDERRALRDRRQRKRREAVAKWMNAALAENEAIADLLHLGIPWRAHSKDERAKEIESRLRTNGIPCPGWKAISRILPPKKIS